jgi:aryl-alcohol dehydrogenase-like predicted oxidoreductase
VSIIAWGALAEGFLTGNFHRGMTTPPPGAKFWVAKEEEMFSWKRLATERNWNTFDILAQIAAERKRSVVQIALRWLLDSGTCDVALFGADRVEQVEENLAVSEFRLTGEEVRRLREVSEHPHPYPINFYDIFCRRESEFYGGLR